MCVGSGAAHDNGRHAPAAPSHHARPPPASRRLPLSHLSLPLSLPLSHHHHHHPTTNRNQQHCHYMEAFCGPRTCSFKGGAWGHISWELPLLPATYFVPSAFLHAFLFFVPTLAAGDMVKRILMVATIFIGPVFSMMYAAKDMSSYPYEWATIWCVLWRVQGRRSRVRARRQREHADQLRGSLDCAARAGLQACVTGSASLPCHVRSYTSARRLHKHKTRIHPQVLLRRCPELLRGAGRGVLGRPQLHCCRPSRHGARGQVAPLATQAGGARAHPIRQARDGGRADGRLAQGVYSCQGGVNDEHGVTVASCVGAAPHAWCVCRTRLACASRRQSADDARCRGRVRAARCMQRVREQCSLPVVWVLCREPRSVCRLSRVRLCRRAAAAISTCLCGRGCRAARSLSQVCVGGVARPRVLLRCPTAC